MICFLIMSNISAERNYKEMSRQRGLEVEQVVVPKWGGKQERINKLGAVYGFRWTFSEGHRNKGLQEVQNMIVSILTPSFLRWDTAGEEKKYTSVTIIWYKCLIYCMKKSITSFL